MFLSRLIIENYRSIKYLDIPFSRGKNVIVGKNNSGKSNIARALNLVLGEKYPTYSNINENDFFTKDGESENYFLIACILEGEDIDIELIKSCKGFFRGKIIDKPFNKENKIIPENIFFDPDEYYRLNSNNKSYIKSAQDKEEWANSRKNQRITFIFYVKTNNEDEEKYSKELRLVYREDNEYYISWGLSKQMRDAFLTSAIVESFRDTNNIIKISNYSWYGKLIKQIWEQKKNSTRKKNDACQVDRTIEDEIKSKLFEIQTITNEIFSDVATDIENKIDISFDNTKISFQFTSDNKADIHKSAQIYVDDGFKSHIRDKGSGIQSAVIINIFSYYCYCFHKNTSLLVIEEPELYLHPQGRRALSQKLEDFIKLKEDKENQVILTTHSSEFISASRKLSGITIVRKEDKETKAKHYKFEGIETKELQILLKNENSEMFFADKVILVEGGEKFLIPIIADKITNEDNILDNRNISVIRVNGKDDFYKYHKILKLCGIECFIIADRDYFFDGLNNILNEFNNISDEEKKDIQKFASEVNKNSVRGYKKLKKLEERMLKADATIDAKSLCDSLEALSVEQNTNNIGRVIETWEYLKPKVQKKDVEGYMKENKLYDKFLSYRQKLWKNNKLWILERGELENYLTKEGKNIGGGKEKGILNIVRKIDSTPLDKFIEIQEFEAFLNQILSYCNYKLNKNNCHHGATDQPSAVKREYGE